MNRKQRRANVKHREKEIKVNPLMLAAELSEKAYQLYQQGHYSEAEPLFRHVLEIHENQPGKENIDVADSLNTLAVCLKAQGNYAEAEYLYRRSLAVYENQSDQVLPKIAMAQNNLGNLLKNCGNYVESEFLYRRCLEIREAIDSENPDTANVQCDLANLLRHIGEYAESESLYRRSLNTRENKLKNGHPDIIKSELNLASLLAVLGRYSEAESLYRRSITICKKHYDFDHPIVALVLNNWACFLDIIGNHSEAVSECRRSLEIREKRLGVVHPDVAESRHNMAVFTKHQGSYPEAEFHCRRSLEIRQKRLGVEHHSVASTLRTLGGILIKIGNHAEAELHYIRTLEILGKTLGNNHLEFAATLNDLAGLLSVKNNLYPAILLAKRSVNICQNSRHSISNIGKDALVSFDRSIEFFYNNLSDLLIKAGRYGEAEYVMGMLKDKENFELLRRDSQTDLPTRTITYNDAEAPLIDRFDELGTSLYTLGQRQEALVRNKVRTAEQNHELVEIKKQIEQVNKEFQEFLDNLHDVLPPREVYQIQQDSYRLIDLSETSPGTVAITPVTAEETFHTILATPCGCKTFSKDYREEDIAKKILQFRGLLKDVENDDYLPLAKELYDIIIRPMEKELEDGNIKTLLWMLNGPLRLLPLAALHDGRQFVLEKYRNVCITTISKIGSSSHEQWNGLGMGVTQEHEGHDALVNVKDELEGIIIKGDSTGVIPGDILLDKAFTRDAMENYLGHGYKAVHIASHFELNPASETMSYLLLGDGSKIRMDELSCKSRLFKGVDLVAFSACSTGLGTASTRGREVDGIGYLGELQGAKTVLATLWPVEDKSTSIVMREFYRLRESGMTKAEALQQAQLSLLNGKLKSEDGHDFSHPYFWAPFILIGNGG